MNPNPILEYIESNRISAFTTSLALDFVEHVDAFIEDQITVLDFRDLLNEFEQECIELAEIINPRLITDVYLLTLVIEQINDLRTLYGK